MPDVAASDPLSLALEALRTLLANSTWFQTWTGSADAAAALKRVVIGTVGYNVATMALTANVATITTREPHNLITGQVVTLEGVSSTFDGARTLTSAADDRTFTFALVAADIASTELHDGIVIQTARPFAVLQEDENQPLRVQTLAPGATIIGGSIDIFIDAAVSSQYQNDPRNAKIEMSNAFGGFLNALRDMSGSGDYMLLNTIEAVSAPSFITIPEQKDNQVRYETWQAVIRVSWGLEG